MVCYLEDCDFDDSVSTILLLSDFHGNLLDTLTSSI